MLKHRKTWYHGAHIRIWNTWSTRGLFSWKTYCVLRRRPSNLTQFDPLEKTSRPKSNRLAKFLFGPRTRGSAPKWSSSAPWRPISTVFPIRQVTYYLFIRQGPRLNWPCGESIAIHFQILLLLLSLLRFILSFFIFQPYLGLGSSPI